MAKAIHSGTCQVCGRLQKLPGGALSKHGYTKQWGFFNGTCPGAGYLPFELQKDKAEAAVTRVQAIVEKLRGQIAELNAAPVENTAPFKTYNSRLGVYQETTVTVEEDVIGEKKIPVTLIRHEDGTREQAMRYGLYGSVTEIVLKLRRQRAGRIQLEVQNNQGYINWQNDRLKNWAPAPEKLVPVVKEEK